MRLVVYYLALKNDLYGIEAMRQKRCEAVKKFREKNSSKVVNGISDIDLI